MTFNVWIYPEHALLWSVRYALSKYPDPDQPPNHAYIAAGSACALSLQGAFEAIVNRLLEAQGKLQRWDELRITSKVDTVAELAGHTIDWGKRPWQEIARLIRLRNWLAHNKEAVIGLINSEGKWILGGLKNRIPKLDPEKELLKDSIHSLYNSVREAGVLLAEMVGQADEFEFLKTEEYEPRLVG